jgi:hypothetical protein
MPLQLLKDREQSLTPHRAALKDNLLALRSLRAQVDALSTKDRAAAADQALCEATSGEIQTLQDAIDKANAEARYADGRPPDLKREHQQLHDAQARHKAQAAVAREATHVRAKFAADIARLNHTLSEHARAQPLLLFNALRDDLASLAAEFLEKEQAFLDVHKRAFAAALAVDVISKEHSFGQFVNSGSINDLHLSRPSLPAFVRDATLTVEQQHAARNAYIRSASEGAAQLVQELLAIAD